MLVSSIENWFETLPQRFVSSASKGVRAVYQFELAGDSGGTYHVKVNDGTLETFKGASEKPDATLKMKAEDYLKMTNGEISGTMAFMKGQLKVSGNVMLAQKLQAILPPHK